MSRRKNGFTKVPNEILEKLASMKMAPNDWRIVCAIIRKTNGWHKDMDRISHSQFEKMTGIRRPHVARTIKRLKKRNIVISVDDGYKPRYSLQTDCSLWID